MPSTDPARILIVGGGYVGLTAARRLERRLEPREARVTLVTPDNFMTYQPLLPEVASGTLEARHAVVPLRRALRRTEIVQGRLHALDHERRIATIGRSEDEPTGFGYDHIVLGLGSVTRVLPVPGLAEHAVGFSTLAEAVGLRDRVLERLEAASATRDAAVRRRALTFVFVGGGYAGVEALAELEDMARTACRQLPVITPDAMQWVLVEATDRILPALPGDLSGHAVRLLSDRGVDVRLETTLEAVEDGMLRLSDGDTLAADTLVWGAGIRPHPLAADLGLPTTEEGAIEVDAFLRAAEGAWAAGDCAAVPDPDADGQSPPTAQHAQRQARRLADNLVATLRGEPLSAFRHRPVGELVTLGRRQGVGQVLGRPLTGLPVWLLRRAYYGVRIPTAGRKLRVGLEWLIGLPFAQDTVHLRTQRAPHEPLRRAADEAAGRAAGHDAA
jgi:NADH:ubiquinone reductase (H+-translocating)